MTMGGALDYEAASADRFEREIVVTDGDRHQAPREAAYAYQRADGTVEHAASVEDAIARCPVLGELALRAPDQANALLALASTPSTEKPDAAKQPSIAEDTRVEADPTAASTTSELSARKAESTTSIASEEHLVTVSSSFEAEVSPSVQADSGYLQASTSSTLAEIEILRETQAHDEANEMAAPEDLASEAPVDVKPPQIIADAHSSVMTQAADPSPLQRQGPEASAVPYRFERVEEVAPRRPAVLSKPAQAEELASLQEMGQTKAANANVVPEPNRAAMADMRAEGQSFDVKLGLLSGDMALREHEALEPAIADTEAEIQIADVVSEPGLAQAEYDDEPSATDLGPVLAAPIDFSTNSREAESLIRAKGLMDTVSAKINLEAPEETRVNPDTDPPAAVEVYMEDLEPARAEAARELVGDVTLMIKEYKRLPQTAAEEKEVMKRVIIQLSTQLLESIGEDSGEEAVKRFVAEIAQLATDTEADPDSRQYSEDYLNRMGTREYKALDQSSVLGSLTGFIKQKLRLHLELARYSMRACVAW